MAEPGASVSVSASKGDDSDVYETPAVVKVGSNRYLLDLEEACTAYLSRHCPDWQQWLERPFFFPPVFPVRYIAPTGQASGAVRLTKSEEQDVKGDEAELKLFHAFERLGREKKQPMFVLTKLECSEFMRIAMQRACLDESLECTEELDTASGGMQQTAHPLLWLEELKRPFEVDALVVHKQVGIILFEVKAVMQFKPSRYLDAKKQLDAAERIVQALLNVKIQGHTIPVYKVIALPNVKTAGRGGGYIDLRFHDLEVGEDGKGSGMERWWAQLPRKHFTEKEQRALLELVAVFVGQRASLCAYALILTDVFSTIDSQRFLAQAYQKQQKKHMRSHAASPGATMVSTIAKSRDDPKLYILTQQFVFLNPEQLVIWDGPERQLITGVTGSGKTILIQHKALECAQRSEVRVLVFIPSPLTLLYEQFFQRNAALLTCPKLIQVVSFEKLPEFIRTDAMLDNPHIFADELQVLISNPCHDEMLDFASFTTFLARNQHANHYQWLCYDSIQTHNELMLTDDEQRWKEFDNFRDTICKNLGFVHSETLTTAMRYTKEVFDFLSSQQPYCRLSLGSPQMLTHLKDLETATIYLGHNISGPQVEVQVLPGDTMEEQVRFASFFITKELKEWALSHGQYNYSSLAVLTEEEDTVHKALVRHLRTENIPTCDIGEFKDAVTLGWSKQARSFEWPVVVAVRRSQSFSFDIVQTSRAVVRLFILEFIFD